MTAPATDTPQTNKPIALVVQRYGAGIVGGSEAHARAVAQKLHHELGMAVTVLTTTARDYTTWANELPAGISNDNGVKVRRFPNTRGRSPWFRYYEKIATPLILRLQRWRLLKPLAHVLAKAWFQLQGPYCPQLVAHLRDHHNDFHKVLFFTYLYYPTLRGLPVVAHKSVLVPTAHNEPAFFFDDVKAMLAAAGPMLVNCREEEALIKSQVPSARTEVVGLGIDLAESPAALSESALACSTSVRQPYLLYLGRISRGKGVHNLIAFFNRFQTENPSSPFQLILAGQAEGDIAIPASGPVKYLGFVTPEQKAELLHQATVVVNPSPLESLSMIVLEAMWARTPVLVNSRCPVLADYTRRCATAFGFADYPEFAQQLQMLQSFISPNAAQNQDLVTSQAWVADHYGWPKVLEHYQKALN